MGKEKGYRTMSKWFWILPKMIWFDVFTYIAGFFDEKVRNSYIDSVKIRTSTFEELQNDRK